MEETLDPHTNQYMSCKSREKEGRSEKTRTADFQEDHLILVDNGYQEKHLVQVSG
jgi:hypothetical protein